MKKMRTWVLSFSLVFMLAGLAGAEEERVALDIAGRPVLGAADAPVTIAEFLDFQ